MEKTTPAGIQKPHSFSYTGFFSDTRRVSETLQKQNVSLPASCSTFSVSSEQLLATMVLKDRLLPVGGYCATS
jgi:hypothetical protein